MEETITILNRSLRLTDTEDYELSIGHQTWDDNRSQLAVVARLISDQTPLISALKGALERAFNAKKGLTILTAEEGRFIIQFNHSVDKEKALIGAP